MKDLRERAFLHSVHLLLRVVNPRFHGHRHCSLGDLPVYCQIVGHFKELLKLSHLLRVLALIFDELVVDLLHIYGVDVIWVAQG